MNIRKIYSSNIHLLNPKILYINVVIGGGEINTVESYYSENVTLNFIKHH